MTFYHVHSCQPHDAPIATEPKHQSLLDCQLACEANADCAFINYAVTTDEVHCMAVIIIIVVIVKFVQN